jgi:putative peptidoglycan lipid II flippase
MIFKNSVIIASFSGLSVLMGVLRDRLLVQYVGIGPLLDIYNASFRIPDLVLGMMAAFAGTLIVVPFITKAVHENNTQDLEERFSSLLIFFGITMSVIALLIIIFIPFFAKAIVPGFTGEQLSLFIRYTRVLMIQPILLGLSTLISALAQVRHQFLLYCSAPLIYTFVIILSIFIGYPLYGLNSIIFGVIVGSALHLLVQSITLYYHPVQIRLSRFKWSLIKEQLKISLPRSLSTVVSQLRTVFFTAFATTLGVGVLSIYVFAHRIIDAIIQVISQSVSTANLPLLSAQYATGDFTAYKKTIRNNIIVIFSVTTIAAIACVLLSQLIVRILYGDVNGNGDIAFMLMILSLGLPLYSINSYTVTAFNAMKDNMSLLITNIASTGIAIVVCFILRDQGFGLVSIGIGELTVSLFYTLFMLVFYFRKKHLFQ